MIRVCSGFPPEWPEAARERFLAGFALHWPASVELVADRLSSGGSIDHYRLIAPAAAADDMADGDLVAWLDPGVETLSAVPSYLVPQLIKDADLCYLGRPDSPTDLRFWAVRLSAATRAFLLRLANAALSGEPGGTLWDEQLAGQALSVRDLTPNGIGDIWSTGPLARYTQIIRRPE